MSDMLLLRRRVMVAGAPKVKRFYIIRNGVLENGGSVSFLFLQVAASSETQTRYIAGSGVFLSMLGSRSGAWPVLRMIIDQPYNTDDRKFGIKFVNTGWPTSGSNNRGAFLDVAKSRPTAANQKNPRFSAPSQNGAYERIWTISEMVSDAPSYRPGSNYLSYWIWGYGNTTTYQTLITDLWLE